MEYLECKICGYKKVKRGASVCPVCGSPSFLISGNLSDRAQKRVIMELKKKNLKSVDIFLVVYQYEIKEDSLVVKSIEEIKIASGDQLVENQIKWNEEKFARVEEQDGETNKINISIKIKRFNLEIEEKVLQIKIPKTEGLWRVGVKRVNELEMQVIIGEDKINEASQNIILL